MPATAFAENKLAELIKGGTITGPAKLFLALAEGPQKRTITGTTIENELSYAGYARTEIPLANIEIVAGTEGAAAKLLNSAAVSVPVNTNTTGKNKAETFVLCDALTLGNAWIYGTLAEIVSIIKAMTEVKFPAKELVTEVN
jgi:hypothetical protein